MSESNGSESTDARDDGADSAELPADVVEEAERLTRLERTVADDNEATAHAKRREELLDNHGFTSRIRDDDGDDVLVCHPAAWIEDGLVRTDRVEDTSRAVEIPLEGTGDPDDWNEVDAHNREIATVVRERHGGVHGDNAAALADFVGNHYAKSIESLTAEELAEFRTEYFVRNAWPSKKQRTVIDESIELIYETVGEAVPGE
ncbi:DUF7108 family protein [Natronobacterium gregoryi]|uniref:RnhA operon protein n=2 Tax=Natronobacterium gregoryi TaxID=44930 RepID=L0AJT3_NATGS|nr:hypothetical protein [Natronobacterium gregoryi]AFZ73699.1 hypothetical protein Natgr_2542 [Natronobacterium gregoryi SP2]ELY67659.1 hypothetical protein C490_10832 [Natronobacterium gregoryi SP2]PLK19567.1 rnhA operon protein [Natronobacterium gregoryi SP2]SFJ01478.1 hypothetical protein SAMN05443661_11176 [Natronobacterium gregoryi]